jgi:antitoxin (DNA-binding transcriptional repressor) of toxin-antitoxin stability system
LIQDSGKGQIREKRAKSRRQLTQLIDYLEMTKTANAEDLAAGSSEFLNDVQAGNDVILMRGEKPIARLIPVNSQLSPARRTLQNLKTFRGIWKGERIVKSGDIADEIFGER